MVSVIEVLIHIFDIYEVLCFLQTKLYTEDWIGLKILDEAGKVKFFKVPGNHLQISTSDMQQYVVPYLKDETSTAAMRPKMEQPSADGWISSVGSFLSEMVGLNKHLPLLRIVN